ncbi:MAG: hypothetical protein ACNA8W_19090, partial [Bradymonadaceae bacterium]
MVSGNPGREQSRRLIFGSVTLLFLVGLASGCGEGRLDIGEKVEATYNQENSDGGGHDNHHGREDIVQDEPDVHAGDTGEEDEHPAQEEQPDSVEVLVMFADTDFAFSTPVDIELNGQRHQFFGREQDDPLWTTSLLDARGIVLELEGPLTRVAFDPEQIRVEGLNVHGYGLFNYVIQKRHPDADLHQL